ncbi:MAG: hypothetical protein ACRD4X_16800, partial [Candidatus Acidiferrales bacterium]
LGSKETGAHAALPIWLEFMEKSLAGKPVEQFQGVVPLEDQVAGHVEEVDTPDQAPPADSSEQGLKQTSAPQTPALNAPDAAPKTQAASPALPAAATTR